MFKYRGNSAKHAVHNSWSRFCTVNHQATSYQLTNPYNPKELKSRTMRWDESILLLPHQTLFRIWDRGRGKVLIPVKQSGSYCNRPSQHCWRFWESWYIGIDTITVNVNHRHTYNFFGAGPILSIVKLLGILDFNVIQLLKPLYSDIKT